MQTLLLGTASALVNGFQGKRGILPTDCLLQSVIWTRH